MRVKLTAGAEGELVLPPKEAEALGLPGGGEVDILHARGAFAMLAPVRERTGEPPRAFFAGSFAALGVAEVVQQLFASLQTGVLLLAFGPGADRGAPDQPERLRRKSLYFRDGQLVFASSSDPADRLGPVLQRAGFVSEQDLARCSRLVRSGRPLGQVLVEENVLSSAQLYEGVARQVKEILLGAFVEVTGTFAFLAGPLDEESSTSVKQPQRTRELLLEGMKRIEEADRLAEGLGGRAAVLSKVRAAPPAPLAPAEAALYAAVDGSRTLEAAADEAGVNILDALRAARLLVDEGALAATPPEAPAPTPIPAAPPEVEIAIEVGAPRPADRPERSSTRGFSPFELYRRIFRRVHAVLVAGCPDARARLDSYFERLPARNRAIFEGVRFGEDGEVDVARVLDNVNAAGQHKGAAAKARSLEALEDLLAFALFEVKNCLPRAEAETLLREVGRMQVGKA